MLFLPNLIIIKTSQLYYHFMMLMLFICAAIKIFITAKESPVHLSQFKQLLRVAPALSLSLSLNGCRSDPIALPDFIRVAIDNQVELLITSLAPNKFSCHSRVAKVTVNKLFSHRIDVFKIPTKNLSKKNKFHTLVAVNIFQLLKPPTPLYPPQCQCEGIEMRIRNYSNTLSYEVITMALRTSRLRQSLTMGIPRSMPYASCRGSQTGGRGQGEGRGDRVIGCWIQTRRVYPFSKDICFCALQFR